MKKILYFSIFGLVFFGYFIFSARVLRATDCSTLNSCGASPDTCSPGYEWCDWGCNGGGPSYDCRIYDSTWTCSAEACNPEPPLGCSGNSCVIGGSGGSCSSDSDCSTPPPPPPPPSCGGEGQACCQNPNAPYCGGGLTCCGAGTVCTAYCIGGVYLCGDGICGNESGSCPADCGGGPPACSCTGWSNQGCGVNGCAANQQWQSRTCNPAGCDTEGQCVFDNSCGASSCGDGTCDSSAGENCTTCSQDCGVCPSGTPSPTPTPTPSGNQCDTTFYNDLFHVCYFDGTSAPTGTNATLNQFTDANVPGPVGAATAFDHDWGSGQIDSTGKSDQVSGVWRGNINFKAGTYTFHTLSDDGVELHLQALGVVISDWTDHGPTQDNSSNIVLPAGTKQIQLRWYENGGGARIKLWWDFVPAAPPTASIDASPNPIPYLGQTTISWSSTNADDCSILRDGVPTGVTGTSGSRLSAPLTTDTLYTADCTGPGGEASASVLVVVNQPPPTVSNVVATQPDYCTSGPGGVVISWTYSDPLNSPQSAYQVQVTSTGDFNNPDYDSGKIINSGNSFSPNSTLQFNTTYKARVRVWNSSDLVSSWSVSSSWKTPIFAYPQAGFTWAPNSPAANATVQFTDTTVFGGNPLQRQWSWIFGDGTVSSLQNPTHAYVVESTYQVILTATDSANQSCSAIHSVVVHKPLPQVKEVAPK